MSGNTWIQYVKFYREKNPHLSYREAMQEAKESYAQLKKQLGGSCTKCQGCIYNSPGQSDHMGPGGCLSDENEEPPKQEKKKENKKNKRHLGGYDNIDLKDPQLRFEAGVSALNSNLAGIGRQIIY
jgi:hypothetical protein